MTINEILLMVLGFLLGVGCGLIPYIVMRGRQRGRITIDDTTVGIDWEEASREWGVDWSTTATTAPTQNTVSAYANTRVA